MTGTLSGDEVHCRVGIEVTNHFGMLGLHEGEITAEDKQLTPEILEILQQKQLTKDDLANTLSTICFSSLGAELVFPLAATPTHNAKATVVVKLMRHARDTLAQVGIEVHMMSFDGASANVAAVALLTQQLHTDNIPMCFSYDHVEHCLKNAVNNVRDRIMWADGWFNLTQTLTMIWKGKYPPSAPANSSVRASRWPPIGSLFGQQHKHMVSKLS